MGDRILKVNGSDVTSATHQEAVMELLRPCDDIGLTIQHDPLPPGFQVRRWWKLWFIWLVNFLLRFAQFLLCFPNTNIMPRAKVPKILLFFSFSFASTSSPTLKKTSQRNNFFLPKPHLHPKFNYESKSWRIEKVPIEVNWDSNSANWCDFHLARYLFRAVVWVVIGFSLF